MTDSQSSIHIPAETSDQAETLYPSATNLNSEGQSSDSQSSDSQSSDSQSSDSQLNDRESALPEFGLVDVVEAFTAMRHEFRGQTRENRELAESMHGVANSICELETQLMQQVSNVTDDDVARHLANLVVDIDMHLTRAVQAVVSYDANRRGSAQQTIREAYHKLNFVARWFCQPFLKSALQAVEPEIASNPSTEGLSLVVSRLRHLMNEQQFDRIETVGQPFDPEKMNAIAAVVSDVQPSGHVVEQLSPVYCWRGRVLRFAEVRVAQ